VLAVSPVRPREYEKVDAEEAVVEPTEVVNVDSAKPGSVPYSK